MDSTPSQNPPRFLRSTTVRDLLAATVTGCVPVCLWGLASLAGLAGLGIYTPEARAQLIGTMQQPGEVYARAMTAFNNGDFATALVALQEMLTLGAEGPGMESVHFSIAAAHFNLKDAAKAKAAFQNYLKLFPSGSKINDAMLAIAQCELLAGNKAKAIEAFAEVAKKSNQLREQATLAQVALLKDSGKKAEAETLLTPLVSGELNTAEKVQGALMLGGLKASLGKREEALKILENLQGKLLHLVDNPLQLNALAFEVGDAFLNANEHRRALRIYGTVRRKEEALQLQQQRIQILVRRYEANINAAKADPSKSLELISVNQRIRNLIEGSKTTLEQAAASTDNLNALRARQALAYRSIGKLDQAVLLLEHVLAQDDKIGRPEALFSLGAIHAETGNSAECVRVLDLYRKESPNARNLDAALLYLGVHRLQLDQVDGAMEALDGVLKRKPESKLFPTAQFLLANTYFATSRFEEAIAGYEVYLKRFPKGEYLEEARYRTALAQFFTGSYQTALEGFEEYKETHPNGLFIPDVEYRIAACYAAATRPADVIKLCTQWEASHGDHPVLGDVLALRADALVALDRREEALAAYRKSSVCASTEEVVHYTLFAANKELQRLGRWQESAQMFREFLASKPDHPSQVLAMYWLAKSMVKDGKIEEAKTFLASKIRQFIEDRSKDAVEQLLSQLAQICSKPPRLSALAEPAAPANVSATTPALATEPAAAAAPAAPYDAQASLESLLSTKDFPNTPLVKARVLFAMAELARFMKKGEQAEALLDRICDEIPADTLGASLLAQCSDRLLARGKHEEAVKSFKELLKAFPKSEVLDFAYNGLGQVALAEGKAEEALKHFDDAVDKAGATSKLREVTLGRGKALLLLERTDEARPILEQVASTKEWRGEATAEAILLLGEILEKSGDSAGAIQYFQRVFVAYQRYPKHVARAYIRAAETFEKLNEPEKAAAHYRELLSKPKLAAMPEVATARERLKLEAAQ